ncbi:MAG: hypothetical protein JSR82_20875 [Verrucomicrobia bacterium]|nr:hypothetical protein [Verrucomicrobiota bacterium]
MRALTAALLYLVLLLPASAAPTTLFGQAIAPGRKITISFPLSPEHQRLAAEGGNPVCTTGVLVMHVPAGFDPKKPQRVLMCVSTSDFDLTSPQHMPLYRDTALAEGWVVMATDGPVKAKKDSTQWRLAFIAGALDMLQRQWPASKAWPVAFAGYSGGAKRCAYLLPMLARSGVKFCGLFLTGINDDRLSESYDTYGRPSNITSVPIFMSGGRGDKIAPPEAHLAVKRSMERKGFNVKLELFDGGHEVHRPHVREALRWFAGKG